MWLLCNIIHCFAESVKKILFKSLIPFALPPQQKETEIPTFKEHLNLLEKISNRKLEKVKHPGTTEEEKTKEKKGFFRRLFKKKEAK